MPDFELAPGPKYIGVAGSYGREDALCAIDDESQLTQTAGFFTIDPATGNPAPSGRMNNYTLELKLAVKSGARKLQVQVLQPTATASRPWVSIAPNPAIGLTSWLKASATSATGWQTIELSFTATANGGIRVTLGNPSAQPCWWDEIRII